MYDRLLPLGLKGLRCFPACCNFLDDFIEIWIKLVFKEKQKRIPKTQLYFQGSCINELGIASFFLKKLMVLFRLYLKQYHTWQICVIACKSVIEALNISSKLQFWTDLMLVCTHLQYLFTTFILPKSIYLLL